MDTRWIMFVLAIAGLALQGQLWLSDTGFRKTSDLREAVTLQRAQNETLALRNQALEAEVMNLKTGRAAAEERARTDLGLIGQSETFYQVVPAGGDKLVADVPR